MYKLIQVYISRVLLQCSRGEITETTKQAFLDGVNTALAERDYHFEEVQGITSGSWDIPDVDRTAEEYKYFLNGFSLVMDTLKSTESVSDLEELYAVL